VILVGTAHISQESVELVKLVIEQEHPDGVCVELDAKRFEAISHPNRWESLDLKDIIRQKQLSTLMVNLVLASFQKRLGDKLGVTPGTEMLEAIRMAEKHNAPVILGDRDVRVTMRRAWRNTPFFRKSMLLSSLLLSIFDTTEVSEDEIRNLKKKDVLSEMMKDLGKEVPTLKEVLIDERDLYLAKTMVEAPGTRTVAVVGAGHVEGICKTIENQKTEEINLETALVDVLFHTAVNLRAGILLSPIGRFNIAHDSPRYDIIERPLVSTEIIPSTLSEVGLGFFGALYPTQFDRIYAGHRLDYWNSCCH
jgi:pheromone shutdown-related protein TraB